MDLVLERAHSDAQQLEEAGFDGLMVENFGDAPFYADAVPPETVAGITRSVASLSGTTTLRIGVNVLRNDGLSAVGIAAAVDAKMIRVNVLSGMMNTDQGPIVGEAAQLVRERQRLSPDTQIWADVMVKHATPPPGLETIQAATDTWERGGADALVLSGPGTGHPLDLDEAATVREALPNAPLVVGSGGSVDNIAQLLEVFDCAIVGSATKVDGVVTNEVDPARAAAIVTTAN